MGISSHPSRPKEVVGIVVFVLVCAALLPVAVAALALAAASVLGPPIMVALRLLSGRFLAALGWAAVGCLIYWLDYRIVTWFVGQRRSAGPRLNV